MSVFDSFAADSLAPFLTGTLGEPGFVVPKGGSPRACSIIVLRDQLQTRATDKNTRLEYTIEVQIAMADYPGGRPNIGGDAVQIAARKGDTTLTTKKVSKIIGQAGAMWRLGLD